MRSHESLLRWLGERDTRTLTARSAFPWFADPYVRIIRGCGREPPQASPNEPRRECL